MCDSPAWWKPEDTKWRVAKSWEDRLKGGLVLSASCKANILWEMLGKEIRGAFADRSHPHSAAELQKNSGNFLYTKLRKVSGSSKSGRRGHKSWVWTLWPQRNPAEDWGRTCLIPGRTSSTFWWIGASISGLNVHRAVWAKHFPQPVCRTQSTKQFDCCYSSDAPNQKWWLFFSFNETTVCHIVDIMFASGELVPGAYRSPSLSTVSVTCGQLWPGSRRYSFRRVIRT